MLCNNASSYLINSFSVCASQLSETEGQFTSPGYPLQYNNHDYCTWHIQVKDGYLVKLHVQVQSILKPYYMCYDDVLQVKIEFSAMIVVYDNLILFEIFFKILNYQNIQTFLH